MPRLDRLLKLAEMFRQNQTGTVREMSRLCGVSQRTIFRDLKTIAHCNLPEGLRTGAEKTNGHLKVRELDSVERRLLGFILDHNPLMRNDYLAWRLKCIKSKLGDQIKAEGREPKDRTVEIFPSSGIRKRTSGDGITSIFLSACKSNRPLSVKVWGDGGELALVPHSIRIQSTMILLSFREPSSGDPVMIEQRSIESLRLLRPES